MLFPAHTCWCFYLFSFFTASQDKPSRKHITSTASSNPEPRKDSLPLGTSINESSLLLEVRNQMTCVFVCVCPVWVTSASDHLNRKCFFGTQTPPFGPFQQIKPSVTSCRCTFLPLWMAPSVNRPVVCTRACKKICLSELPSSATSLMDLWCCVTYGREDCVGADGGLWELSRAAAEMRASQREPISVQIHELKCESGRREWEEVKTNATTLFTHLT